MIVWVTQVKRSREKGMTPRAIEVEDNGTLRVVSKRADNPQSLEDALSLLADRIPSSDLAPRYRLSAASVRRARRMGLSLERIVETLERHSGQTLPAKLRSDLTLWSEHIERLRLELDAGRLVLCSDNPLVITAVMSHRTLSGFVAEQLDANRAELRAEAYPELIDTFDACRYPVLDHVPSGWRPDEASPVPGPRRLPAPPRASVTPRSKRRPHRSGGAASSQAATHQCQAITQRGRQCKNRVRPPTRYCRVHADRGDSSWIDTDALSLMSWHAYLEAVQDEETLSLVQLARSRVVILMWIGLSTWLVSHLLRAGLLYGLGWSPVPWIVTGMALVLSCGILGRLVAGLGVLSTLGYVGLYVLSIGFDCLHKEGLIVNLCYVVIPVLLPLWGLSQVGLSWAWVFACFPVGMVAGGFLYTFLDAMSSW